MKKFSIIIFILFLFLYSLPALAHPPQDIIFNYDAKIKILSVGILHSVENPNNHFIKEIKIKVNGKDWIVQDFLSQTTPDAQAVSYAQVELKKGDIVEVLAVCSKSGQLSKKFEIE